MTPRHDAVPQDAVRLPAQASATGSSVCLEVSEWGLYYDGRGWRELCRSAVRTPVRRPSTLARSLWVELSRLPDQRYGYACSGRGVECHSTSFQAPPSRRRIIVVGAEMCCGVPFIV